MQDKPTYNELAVAVARAVWDHVYLPEEVVDDESGRLVWIRLVDNMCTSYYQIPTLVLIPLGILEPLDDMFRRNDFTCAPERFLEVVAANQSKGFPYKWLVLASICLLEYHPHARGLLEVMARVGVVEPDSDPPYDKGENVHPESCQVRWTTAKAQYDRLYQDWAGVLDVPLPAVIRPAKASLFFSGLIPDPHRGGDPD